GHLPGAGRHGQHRGRVRAPVEAGQLCPADRGSCSVRARGRMSRMSWPAAPGPERSVVAAVIALAPPGRRRAWWALAAMAFSILMGLSRAYLGAHWLSDAVAGILLGTSCAVVTALVVGQIQRHAEGRQRPA